MNEGGADEEGADEEGADAKGADIEGAEEGGVNEGALPLALDVGSIISTSLSVGWEGFRLKIGGKSGLINFSITKWR